MKFYVKQKSIEISLDTLVALTHIFSVLSLLFDQNHSLYPNVYGFFKGVDWINLSKLNDT